jgi:hypothetical protein
MAAGAMGDVASASGVVTASARLSEIGDVEPCRVMAR